ncbi:SDR family NAD(P)-dependent oxidoreductase [Mycobacterium sp.]|jgi:short-subunit dehydrogenase|uniref:SDR family NAD(P)-dependent oxidoreductase n=1 Tax=Mycobacterium sp. TaxID=1785 RepID=UPI0025E70317|nr:SDR family NAD(P)-dependent oxidoreductase [Mycobacterium sp.]
MMDTELRTEQTTQVVVVTGASSGIGKETALLFAGRHARLCLGSRSESALDLVAEECLAAGAADVVVVSIDIAEVDQVQKLFDMALEQFGRIDVVAQCAALTVFGRFEDLPVEVFDTVVRTNLIGAVNVARSALAHFHEREQGHLVLLGSLLGQAAMPYQSAYVVSKFGVHGLVRALRQENSHLPGIKVHGVYPGPVDTAMSSNAGNYFGHPAHVPPTAVGPITVASAIVRATTRGRSTERHVGWLNRPMVVAYRLFPSLFDAFAGQLTRAVQFSGEVTGIAEGNVSISAAGPPPPQ